jgi:tRNA(Ile2)-agmatinylcytidine synthase
LRLHIGFDDTDSPRGGCTTYIAARLVEGLLALGARFTDYPNLLRLNPNVPWKTRGNGTVCLRVEVDPEDGGRVKGAVLRAVEAHSEFWCDNTNPGVVFLEGAVPEDLARFSDRVVQGVVTLGEALELVEEYGASAVGYKNMRGIIGGLAAVGGLQGGDHTFELLSYRMPGNRGRPRLIDAESVRAMDKETAGSTFNNIDTETGRVLIAPHGPDPVLYGVRGETPEAVQSAAEMVEPGEPVERWVIFRTNQGTDAHLRSLSKISEIRPYSPAIAVGEVVREPRTIKGGHVILGIGDGTGLMDCAAYEPTGGFRDVVRRLIRGDGIRAYGGVREAVGGGPETLNLEKLEILRLAPEVVLVNPACPACGGRMESMGRGKGYRCRHCGLRDGNLRKQAEERERKLRTGLHVPPPRAQRHLTKPLVRYGREKKGHKPGGLFEPWHWP